MTGLQPYPEYKPSGIDWLGDAPAHWQVRRLKTSAVINPSKSETLVADVTEQVPFVPMERLGVDGRIDGSLRRLHHEVRNGFTYFREQDVLLAKITPCFENGKSGVVPRLDGGFGYGSTEYHVLRARRVLTPQYLYRIVSSQWFRILGADFMEGSAGQKRVPTDFVANFPIPLPPLDEQRAIADFLDAMDAKITRFIAARRRMIVLLEEQKQAIINQAVTRGLDPDVSLKPSGIDWPGDIPAHWGVRRGAALFTERNLTNVSELPILEVSLVSGVTVRDFENSNRKQMMSDRAGYKVAKQGDLPYNMMRMWQGAVGVATTDGLVSPAYVVLAPRSNVVGEYFSLLFRTPECMAQFGGASRGIVSDRDRLYWESFRQISFAMPPTAEQDAIVKAVHESSRKIDLTASRHRQEIGLIQEYRTRLISDVVTGKLDVRNGGSARPFSVNPGARKPDE